MEVIFVLVGLFALLALPVSLIMMLFKKRRRRGLQIFTCSMFALGISAWGIGQIPEMVEKSAKEEGYRSASDKRQAEAAGYSSSKEWDENREEIIVDIEEQHQKELGGFPDAETKSAANTQGINRYEAYRLLDNEKAISRYCAYAVQSLGMEQSKHIELDATSDEVKQTEIWDKYEAIQRQLLDKFNNDLGLQEYEYLKVAEAGQWKSFCKAAKRGWAVLTREQAREASRDDASKAKNAAEAFYIYALNNGVAHFFNRNRFNAVECTWENYQDYRVVGCRLQSANLQNSEWDFYVTGRLANGELAVAPINGNAETHISQSGVSAALSKSAAQRTFFDAYGDYKAYFAEFAGEGIDIGGVRSEFPN